MHSSSLRGTDFEIEVEGKPIQHAALFSEFLPTRRLGIVAPACFVVGATVNLLMAYVTAFFDCYRASKKEFFAYPDFFSFQTSETKTRYGMFDIWPAHKDVMVEHSHGACINAITDRAINVLVVPEGERRNHTYEPEQLAAAERNVDTCYTYSSNGKVASPDLIIRCKTELFTEWFELMFEKNADDGEGITQWKETYGGTQFLEQSFRRIELDEALQRL
ncbi:MAG: hypothetical protein HOI20_02880 [Gemmatimonadetes bacterium]|jgi:hypothetical protein|nr:hypothetical protein [Gemmatimonadota bacterium]MBT5800529.1 hypothetical protein [Gemmatimonadota bacterium]